MMKFLTTPPEPEGFRDEIQALIGSRLRLVLLIDVVGFALESEAQPGRNRRHLAGVRRQAQACRARIAAGIGHAGARRPGATPQKGLGLPGAMERLAHGSPA